MVMEMNEMKTKQKVEALARMALLKMLPNPIYEFRDEGKLNKSEMGGYLYWLDDDEKKMVREFEEENDATVYHVILSHTDFGRMYFLLYVSRYEEEWASDRNDIKNNTALVYVVNVDMPDCSEFGYIGVEPRFGGVARTS